MKNLPHLDRRRRLGRSLSLLFVLTACGGGGSGGGGESTAAQLPVVGSSPAPSAPGPAVTLALMPAAAPADTPSRRVANTGERPTPADDNIGAFRTVCPYSHMAFDDPIVYPGQPNRSHLHTFFGNTAINGNSTQASIEGTGESTCRGGTANRSGYWIAALIDTRNGQPLIPRPADFYYKTGYLGVRNNQINNLPVGLRMIAGSASNAGPNPNGSPYSWSCHGSGDETKREYIPNCPVGSELRLEVDFPQCWNGRDLDSPDHKSHMQYANGGCRSSSHPIALPLISLNISWPVTEANSTPHWRLSSDTYATSAPGGYSAHADWVNGWDPEVANTFVQNCIRAGNDCGSHILGDGRVIFNTTTPGG